MTEGPRLSPPPRAGISVTVPAARAARAPVLIIAPGGSLPSHATVYTSNVRVYPLMRQSTPLMRQPTLSCDSLHL